MEPLEDWKKYPNCPWCHKTVVLDYIDEISNNDMIEDGKFIRNFETCTHCGKEFSFEVRFIPIYDVFKEEREDLSWMWNQNKN